MFAPLRIGATSQTQFFNGIIDEVFVSTQIFISKDTLTALACISEPTIGGGQPRDEWGLVRFETTLHYDLTVSENHIGFCSFV